MPDPWDASDGQTQHRDENGNLVGETRDDAALGVPVHRYVDGMDPGELARYFPTAGFRLDPRDGMLPETGLWLPLSDAAQQARRLALTTIEDGIFEDWEVDLIFAALGLGAA